MWGKRRFPPRRGLLSEIISSQCTPCRALRVFSNSWYVFFRVFNNSDVHFPALFSLSEFEIVLVCPPGMLFSELKQSSSALLALASQSFSNSGVHSLHKPKSPEHSEIHKDREVYLNLQMEHTCTSTTYINKHIKHSEINIHHT
jgi:hypothetical protein